MAASPTFTAASSPFTAASLPVASASPGKLAAFRRDGGRTCAHLGAISREDPEVESEEEQHHPEVRHLIHTAATHNTHGQHPTPGCERVGSSVGDSGVDLVLHPEYCRYLNRTTSALRGQLFSPGLCGFENNLCLFSGAKRPEGCCQLMVEDGRREREGGSAARCRRNDPKCGATGKLYGATATVWKSTRLYLNPKP
eukprot:104977-Rhodomonas_salina.1